MPGKWKPGPGARWGRDEQLVDGPVDPPITVSSGGRHYTLHRYPWWKRWLLAFSRRKRA